MFLFKAKKKGPKAQPQKPARTEELEIGKESWPINNGKRFFI